MSHTSDSRKDVHEISDDPNVIQLGFNISVAGKSASDFEIYVNDKKHSCGQLSGQHLKRKTSLAELSENRNVCALTAETPAEGFLDKMPESQETAFQGSRCQLNKKSPTAASGEMESSKCLRSEDVRIIDDIKNAMDNFEKFSEHLREIPRLSTKRSYTSTPFLDKNNSRSEGNLSLYGNMPQSYIPKHDFRDRKYFKKVKPLSNNLFLKPLPAEDYFKKGFIRRYYDVESYRHHSSMENLPHYYEYGVEWKNIEKTTAKSDNDKSDAFSSSSDLCASENKVLSKKGEGNGTIDKQSTSSESIKDIKIYQSGGIIIMQNFKDSSDLLDKDMAEGVKIIENCNKLREKVENSFQSSDESQKLLLNSSSDEVKGQSTKSVQFDLSSVENNRTESCDSLSDMQKNDLSNASAGGRNEVFKGKDGGFLFAHNQDFTSLSTQENDSILSNLHGMSPTSSTSGKKLEWDSGADVGYLNTDLTKENISTIERIILKGLSDDGSSKKQVFYQGSEQDRTSNMQKYKLERMSSVLKSEVKNNSTPEQTNSPQSSIPSEIAVITALTNQNMSTEEQEKERKNVESKECKDSRIEKYKTPFTEKINLNNRTHSKKWKLEKNNEDGKLRKSGKSFEKAKEKETVSGFNVSKKENKFAQTPKFDKSEGVLICSDKSTYVNTLFDDVYLDLPIQDLSRSDESGRSESSERFEPCHVETLKKKKLTKKKNVILRDNLSGKMKSKIDTVIEIGNHPDGCDGSQSNGSISTKDLHHNMTGELIGEVKVASDDCKNGTSEPLSMCSTAKISQTDNVARSRPMSASSSSVHTVMHNVESPENVNILQIKNFSDQIIQTCAMMYESKGIQAFHSAKCSAASSQLGEDRTRNLEEFFLDISGVEVLGEEGNDKSVFVHSKSIQAPGMNSSLPKHLAHPKLNVPWNQMNTKSTQFFGGPVTSLPNYHANLPLREMIVGKEKILQSMVISNNDNNRIIQENVKNASVNRPNEGICIIECDLAFTDSTNSVSIDDGPDEKQKRVTKETDVNKINVENKENLTINDENYTDYCKRQTNGSRKASKTNYSGSSGSKKSESIAFGSCEVFLSDDGKNLFLTSELLKEHGDRIDRNIIQEKYFQSQLLELDRMEMISKTTSIEKKSQQERNTQTSFSSVTGVSVSCQYGSSLMNESDEVFYSKTDSGKSTKGNGVKAVWAHKKGRDEYDSFQNQKSKRLNTVERSPEDEFVLVESLSSDTQTANSWVPGVQQESENQEIKNLAREYLQEHIYDDPASLKDKSIYESEQNMQLDDLVQSKGTRSTQTSSSQAKNSGSGHTLVLENTDGSLNESDRLKSLDNNLTELEMVVSRLHEKETIFQKITDSVLSTVSKVNGSGDSSHNQEENRSNYNSNITEEMRYEIEVLEESSKSNNSERKKREMREKSHILNEVSTSCQTDTMKPDPYRIDEEKKKLEQRMNDEKEQQIKWIENEIKHLNKLRSLLEKQEDMKISSQRKKRHHYLTEAFEDSSAPGPLKEEIFRKILADSLSKTSAISEVIKGDQSKSESPLLKLNERSATEALKQFSNTFSATSGCPQLGMSFSLRRIDKAHEVTMLPVGIQVTLRDKKDRSKTDISPRNTRGSLNSEQSGTRVKHTPGSSAGEIRTPNSNDNNQVNNNVNKVTSEVIDSSDSLNRCGCFKCNTSKCDCLKTCEGRETKKLTHNNSRHGKTLESAGIGSTRTSRELSNQDLDIPEIRDISDSRRGSTNDASSGKLTRSPKQEPFFLSSEESISFEKCICRCHAQPLPRCNSCHLLNTCKKCRCYRTIKCCICEINTSKVSLRKKCMSASTSCYCEVDRCHLSSCCGEKSKLCGVCPCHVKVTSQACLCKCKKKYMERSSQTEGKASNNLQNREPLVDESDLYRETKYMSEKQQVTEKRKPSDVSYPAEQKFECESKQPVDEKFPYEMKVPIEKKSADVKSVTETKAKFENLRGEELSSLHINGSQGRKQGHCICRQPRRTSVEDHPRHYFLQVEETTEEESTESCENGTSMEVITIKVPIRKVCNNGKNRQLSPQKNLKKLQENRDTGSSYLEQKAVNLSECRCCGDCLGYSSKRSSFEERPGAADHLPPRVPYDSRKRSLSDRDPCGCCEDCPGRTNLEERPPPEFAGFDNYEKRKNRITSYTNCNVTEYCRNCCNGNISKPLKYPSTGYRSKETDAEALRICNCCDCCDKVIDPVISNPENYSSGLRKDENYAFPNDAAELSTTERENVQPASNREKDESSEERHEKNIEDNKKSEKQKNEDKIKKNRNKSPSPTKPARSHGHYKNAKGAGHEKNKDKCKNSDYYNFNKKEYMTKSELEREEKKKQPSRLTLQECLTVKRPDLYTRAECRRQIISEKSRDRVERHNKRLECLTNLLPQCDVPPKYPDLKLFTSEQMRKQTRKFYKKLPEVANKKAEEKKKLQFRTNKLMAEIFAKKLQLQTLNGRLNMSNSFSVMSTM